MICFKAVIQRFDKKGEKTGWSYIGIPGEIASKIKYNCKKSFRVKGMLDNLKIVRTSMLPMGGGNFIITINASMRKSLGRRKGAIIDVSIIEDERQIEVNKTFLLCLADEPEALNFFNSLAGSHRNYFSKWIESTKTDVTKENRIARAVSALSGKYGYREMMRMDKEEKYE